jgi:hypothetical protein
MSSGVDHRVYQHASWDTISTTEPTTTTTNRDVSPTQPRNHVPLPASFYSGTYPALECDSVAQDAAVKASKAFRQASRWHMQPSHPRHASHRPYARVTGLGRKVWKGAVGQT